MIARIMMLVLGFLVLGAVSAVAVRACPFCDSSQAVEVRAGLADDITPTTLAAVAAPFVIVASVISVVHFGLPNWSSKR
jgi:hypothetical protein